MAVRKYTVVTPIPGFIPRQLALDLLHSHSETITLNPLVLSHRPIAAPRDAAAEEYFSTWYEITERVQYVPGLGKLGSGVIRFHGCFHDLPWGLQTHIYAPAGVDLRVRYRIGGNQPGVEPPEPRAPAELTGLDVPRDGLYLREDIEIKCNIAMVGLVKSQMKAASREMVARIIKKAELLDAGVLQAMIEATGKIRTHNPRDTTYTGGGGGGAISPPDTPFTPPLSPASVPYQVPRPVSFQQQQSNSRPGTSSSAQYSTYGNKVHYQHAAGLPSTTPAVAIELPGDFHHASPNLQPPPHPSSVHPIHDRASATAPRLSQQSSDSGRWSGTGANQPSPSLDSSRTTPYSPDAGGGGGGDFGSPSLNSPGFAAELPTHRETPEEDHRTPRPSSGAPASGPYRAYNPAEYARVAR